MPIELSAAVTQRFHRGGISGVPDRVFPKNAKFSSTNPFGRVGAAAVIRCHRRYVFHDARGSDESILSAAWKKSGCQTFSDVLEARPCSSKNFVHSRFGVAFENAASVIG